MSELDSRVMCIIVGCIYAYTYSHNRRVHMINVTMKLFCIRYGLTLRSPVALKIAIKSP